MRTVRKREKEQRGCMYCEDWVEGFEIKGKYIPGGCKHTQCPYHEMDNEKSYDEYLKHTKMDNTVYQFLKGLDRK